MKCISTVYLIIYNIYDILFKHNIVVFKWIIHLMATFLPSMDICVFLIQTYLLVKKHGFCFELELSGKIEGTALHSKSDNLSPVGDFL